MPKRYDRKHAKTEWKRNDVRQLCKLLAKGLSPTAIASRLNRTVGNTWDMILTLNTLFGKGETL